MQRELKLYLWDMLVAGEDIVRFLEGVSLANYKESELLRSAVERKFSILGEALAQARQLYPHLKDQIGEHREIVAFRNRVVHAVDDNILFYTAQDFLPAFLEHVRKILTKLPA